MLLWTCMRFLPVGRLGAVWRAVLGPYVYIYIYIYIYIYMITYILHAASHLTRERRLTFAGFEWTYST
jgi:hypothetical protein